jgi:hypothetical protein
MATNEKSSSLTDGTKPEYQADVGLASTFSGRKKGVMKIAIDL